MFKGVHTLSIGISVKDFCRVWVRRTYREVTTPLSV